MAPPQLRGGARSAAAAALLISTFLVCYHFGSINDRFYDRMIPAMKRTSPIIRRSLLAAADPSKKRLALVRPFGPHDVHFLLRSFDLWSAYWPCGTSRNDEYDVDLVLSYSRHVGEEQQSENDILATQAVDEIRSKMLGDQNSGWGECFTGLRIIEAGLDESSDHYIRDETGVPSQMDWVEGPNGQFRESIAQLMSLPGIDGDEDGHYYELAFIMEPDNQPQRTGWLNELLDDIQGKTPFALLGSKYKGHSWDGLQDVMPASLVNHINGNAVYNLTSPLFQKYHEELMKEAGTKFAAVPYDYRISQMIQEGRFGTEPEFPFPWIKHPRFGESIKLHKKPKLAQFWKKKGGGDLNEDDVDYPIKESSIISNFGESNYLPEHKGNAALVHGLNVYEPYNPETHNQISLVVTSWDNENHRNDLLRDMNRKHHIFNEVVVMQNFGITPRGNDAPSEGVPYRLIDRLNLDITDVCDAPVSTEWFYHTNSYHQVADKVDLLFSKDDPISRPVVPFTPAESLHCNEYKACRETIRIAREIYPELDKVVLDMDLPYHVPSRNAFCNFWKEMYGMNGEHLALREGGRHRALASSTPIVPTATAYVAFLYRNGLAEHLYHFTNTLLHGSRKLFVRAIEDKHTAALVSLEIENDHRMLKGKPGGGGGGGGGGGNNNPPPTPPPTSPPGGDPTPQPSPSPTPPPTSTPNDQCAVAGQACKGKGALPCCDTYTCENKVCIIASPYGGSTDRRLSMSEPGFLVDD